MEDFIPAGWHLLDSAVGDLNKDALEDLALVIEASAIELPADGAAAEVAGDIYEESEGPPRILVVLLRQKKSGYRCSVQANTFVLRKGDGGVMGDPWAGMIVERGTLAVHFYGGSAWRWGLDYRFRLQDGGWFLIGASNISYHSGSGEMEAYDYNLVTGDVEVTSGNVFGEECSPCEDCSACSGCELCGECEQCVEVPDQVTRQKISKQPLRRMEDFVPLEWEILPGQSI